MNQKTTKIKNFSIINDVGGTSHICEGIYEVKIDKMWRDRETGYRYKGKLISKKDIEFSENVGTTGSKPEDYKKYGEKMYADVLKAQQNFCPSEIYFSEFDIIKN